MDNNVSCTADMELEILNNVIRAMDDYRNGNSNFIKSFKNVMKRKIKAEDIDVFLDITVNVLLREILVLEKEILFIKGNIDSTKLSQNKEFTLIRKYIKEHSELNLNNEKIYEKIRNGIAHNDNIGSEENSTTAGMSRIKLTNNDKNLGREVRADFSFPKELIAKIVGIFVDAENEKGHFTTKVWEDDLRNHLKNNTLGTDNVARFIEIYVDERKQVLDIKQKETLVNFMKALFEDLCRYQVKNTFSAYLQERIPSKRNAEMLIINKARVIGFLQQLRDNKNLTFVENFTMYDKKLINLFRARGSDAQPAWIGYKEDFNLQLIPSLMFLIFTTRTQTELKTLFDNIGLNLSSDKINHLRNSLVHGRYFYNFNDGLEFYDGENQLTHFHTMDFNEMLTICNTITYDAHCKTQELAKEYDEKREV